MKKLSVIFLLLLGIIFSCKNEYEKNIEQMEMKARKHIEDVSFKDNETIDIIELKVDGYKTVGSNRIDSIRLILISSKGELFKEQANNLSELAKIELKKHRSYAELGLNDLAKDSKEKSLEYADKIRAIADTFKNLTIKDSTIRESIKNRVEQEKYYECKLFLKASSTNNNTKTTDNYLDSMVLFFDKNLNVVPLESFQ